MTERKVYTNEEIQEILNKTDWNLYHESINWTLQRPNCNCEFCPAYDNWKEWGLDLFTRDNDLSRCVLEIKEEDARRAGVRASKEFDNQKRSSDLSAFVNA